MPFLENQLLNLLPRCGVDRVFLEKVQGGFQSSGTTWGIQEVLLIVGILVGSIAIFLVLRKMVPFLNLEKYQLAKTSIDRIESPRQIRRIINRSADLRAMYDMEVYDTAYQEIYKCMPIGLNKSNELEVDISAFMDINLDFKDKPVMVSFRTSRRAKQEFYQFETRSLYLDTTDIRGLKERSIRLQMPQIVTRGQKRRHVRIEPRGEYSFSVSLLRPSQGEDEIPINAFKRVCDTTINDISAGGLSSLLRDDRLARQYHADDLVYGYFKLPSVDLSVQNIPTNYFFKAKVISNENLGPAENMMKFMFVERGRLVSESRSIFFLLFSWASFEDLSLWIQAYQRKLLQEDRGTVTRPANVRNIYASEPPQVPSKYPRQPLDRKPTDPA
ncbi:MAG: hypothetical protein JRD68_14240 [Deltaproteobacteria bacterium]|nr:hypothetical protein [Deltaproteobacteria bacterium]